MTDLEALKARAAAVPDGEMVAVYAETVRALVEENERLAASEARAEAAEAKLAEALLNPVSAAPSPSGDEVEAVARAICSEEYGDPDGFAAITLADTERTTPRWHYCKSSARAAIAALRQRAAMDDLLRMDGELYDVPTNQEPRND